MNRIFSYFIFLITVSNLGFTMEEDIQEGLKKQGLTIIYNDENIEKSLEETNFGNDTLIKADAIENEQETISYTIYWNSVIPVKAVLFQVYGGGSYQKYREPHQLSLERALAAEGIAVVVLNMEDIKARGNKTLKSQVTYPKELLSRIKKGIAIARQKIPEILQNVIFKSNLTIDPNFNAQKVKYFLTGVSFGGQLTALMAVDQAYHDLFDGYISRAGATGSYTMEMESGTPSSFAREIDVMHELRKEGKKIRELDLSYLEVLDKVKNLTKPILLVHNLDDPNVHLFNATNLAEEINKRGKSTLLSLYISETGGHGYPEAPKEFEEYKSAIADFILQVDQVKRDPNLAQAITQWKIMDKVTKTAFSYGKGNVKLLASQFIGKALELYNEKRKHNPRYNASNIKDDWDKVYLPLYADMASEAMLFDSFKRFAKEYLLKHEKHEIARFNAEEFLHFFDRLLKGESEESCSLIYKPRDKTLCDTPCTQTLGLSVCPSRTEFVEEQGLNGCQKVFLDWLVKFSSPRLLSSCKKQDLPGVFKNFTIMIKGGVSHKILSEIKKEFKKSFEIEQSLEKDLLNNFVGVINQQQKSAQNVIKQTAKALINQRKKVSKEPEHEHK
jgi:dienelactone hydrolase